METTKTNHSNSRDSLTAQPDLETTTSEATVLSNDPRFAGLHDTPKPVVCEFCGAERYYEGICIIGVKPLWFTGGPKPCICPEGKAEYERLCVEQEAAETARRIAEENRKMRNRVERVIGDSGMGERFLRRTFETFNPTPANRGVLAAALEYARTFDEKLPRRDGPDPGKNGLFIAGSKGTGKTHIAAAIANHLLQKGTAVVCLTERDLLGRIRHTYSRNESGESEILDLYRRVPLLIIDDLGKEKASEWTVSTLYSIVDGRYEAMRPLIITANYSAQDLVIRLTPAGGDRTTADTTVDRLVEMCEGLVLDGKSWRGR